MAVLWQCLFLGLCQAYAVYTEAVLVDRDRPAQQQLSTLDSSISISCQSADSLEHHCGQQLRSAHHAVCQLVIPAAHWCSRCAAVPWRWRIQAPPQALQSEFAPALAFSLLTADTGRTSKAKTALDNHSPLCWPAVDLFHVAAPHEDFSEVLQHFYHTPILEMLPLAVLPSTCLRPVA